MLGDTGEGAVGGEDGGAEVLVEQSNGSLCLACVACGDDQNKTLRARARVEELVNEPAADVEA